MSVQKIYDSKGNRCYDIRMSVLKKDGSSFSHQQLGEVLIKLCKKFVFQEEKGTKTDYRHFQGRVSLIKNMSKTNLLTSIQKLLSCELSEAPQYIEPTVKGVHMTSNFNYVLKDETRVAGPYTEKNYEHNETKEEVYIPIQYRGIVDKLYPYQKEIYDSKKQPFDRIVNLIYDPKGNKGKSSIASLCELLLQGIDIPPLDDFKEIMQMVCDEAMSTKNRSPSPIIIDLPRAMDKKKMNGTYSAIEQIKKGKLFDSRNKYKRWWIDSPVVWVFTNSQPDMKLLSSDRWKIWTIDSDYKLQLYKPSEEDGDGY